MKRGPMGLVFGSGTRLSAFSSEISVIGVLVHNKQKKMKIMLKESFSTSRETEEWFGLLLVAVKKFPLRSLSLNPLL